LHFPGYLIYELHALCNGNQRGKRANKNTTLFVAVCIYNYKKIFTVHKLPKKNQSESPFSIGSKTSIIFLRAQTYENMKIKKFAPGHTFKKIGESQR